MRITAVLDRHPGSEQSVHLAAQASDVTTDAASGHELELAHEVGEVLSEPQLRRRRPSRLSRQPRQQQAGDGVIGVLEGVGPGGPDDDSRLGGQRQVAVAPDSSWLCESAQ